MTEMTEDQARANVSANVTRLLSLRGMKPLRLAEEVSGSLTQNTVYRIVRGETCGTVTMLASIAEVLGVTIDYLLTDPGEHEKKLPRRNKNLSAAC